LCADLREETRLEVQCDKLGIPEPLPPDVSLCLYRVAQEALQNVVRHSGASRATVTLAGTKDTLALTIADEGAGFDAGALVGHASLGLTSMRERVRLAGGTLLVDARKGAGTRIEARIPLREGRTA
jgi:signal transduction histidine kinase